MDAGLSGRVALVGGATSGLGLAVARGLAAEGVRVALVGRRGELLAELTPTIPGSIGIAADLTDPADRDRVLADVRVRLGEVDILIVNGGGPAPSLAQDMSAEDAARAVDLLLLPAVSLVREVLPGMRERGWGRIVAIGSSGIQAPLEGLVGSNVGRAALAAYLKTLSAEVAPDGVTVNMVLPGRIATDRTRSLDENRATAVGSTVEDVRAASAATIPAGRYGTPEEFAAAAVFLIGAPAAYITGEQIRIDGGLVRAY